MFLKILKIIEFIKLWDIFDISLIFGIMLKGFMDSE